MFTLKQFDDKDDNDDDECTEEKEIIGNDDIQTSIIWLIWINKQKHLNLLINNRIHSILYGLIRLFDRNRQCFIKQIQFSFYFCSTFYNRLRDYYRVIFKFNKKLSLTTEQNIELANDIINRWFEIFAQIIYSPASMTLIKWNGWCHI